MKREHVALARVGAIATALAGLMIACETPKPEPPPDPQAELVAKGRRLFFNETFNGNGRTCGTCHPADNNLTLDPAFIARLPKTDPLFVAEFNPDLAKNFENSRLMREFALIMENLDGFDDLDNRFVMRGIPHTIGLKVSIDNPAGPRTGWSGDGAPGDGTLRSFATGAVIQHFTKRLDRVPGVDFRLPTANELEALEAFQASLGRQRELKLPLPLKATITKRGQEIFLDNRLGKCNLCHSNAGSNANFGQGNAGNLSFNTGVEDLPDLRQKLTKEKVPRDDGFRFPGDGTFNTPSLVEAADTGPFFHNNAVDTIEGAVAFYNGASFNNSPAGKVLIGLDPNRVGIRLEATQVEAIAAFLRVINALDNIDNAIGSLEKAGAPRSPDDQRAFNFTRAIADTGDAIRVLSAVGLHAGAIALLDEVRRLARKAKESSYGRAERIRDAIAGLRKARAELVDAS